MPAFMGMRGNGDWTDSDMRPLNWREMVMYEFPNGDTPITAMLSMMGSESTDSAQYHWWDQRLAVQAGTCGIYIDVGLATAYVYATHQAVFGIADAVVYAKVTEAVAKEFRIGHTVVFRDVDRFDVDVTGYVVAVNYNGASSYIGVRLLEADDNSGTAATYNLATVDWIKVIGNSNPEGGAMPRAIAFDPVKYYNYTQIFRTPLEMSRTAKKEKLRTGDQVAKAKKDALQISGVEQENALIWGLRREWIGENGKPERTFDGILNFIKRNASSGFSASGASSINDFTLRSDFASQTWLDGGEDWFDDNLEYLGTYAPTEITAFCGAGALTGLTKLAKHTGNITFEPGPLDTYGLKFTTWMNPHVTIHLKKHPLLARSADTKYSMLLFSPNNIQMRVMDEIQYMPDRQPNGIDGEASEYLGELGPEFHFADQFQWLNGVGQDNDL